jgi:hypothetical protein
MPKGFKIKIARGPMGKQAMQKNIPREKKVVIVSKKEGERRANLEKINAESKVKRIGDIIIYEINAPGVKGEEDVVITELETGIEIRAYSREKCYIKVIPLKVEILGMRVDRERVLVEMKG